MLAPPIGEAPVALAFLGRKSLTHVTIASFLESHGAGDRTGLVPAVTDDAQLPDMGLLPVAGSPARAGLDPVNNEAKKFIGKRRTVAEGKAIEAFPS